MNNYWKVMGLSILIILKAFWKSTVEIAWGNHSNISNRYILANINSSRIIPNYINSIHKQHPKIQSTKESKRNDGRSNGG